MEDLDLASDLAALGGLDLVPPDWSGLDRAQEVLLSGALTWVDHRESQLPVPTQEGLPGETLLKQVIFSEEVC